MSIDLTTMLVPEGVISPLVAASKRQVIQQMTERAARITQLKERDILQVLLERERLGSTAVGKGAAIPHGRFERLEKIHLLLGRLDKPVDFDASDDEPVDLVFLLLAPANANADHLRALARVSRLLRDEKMVDALRSAVTSDNIYSLLMEQEAL